MRYIQDTKEQRRIAMACHVDPTSGHMGMRNTVARVKERFTWKRVYKDVEAIVSYCVKMWHFKLLFSSRCLPVMCAGGSMAKWLQTRLNSTQSQSIFHGTIWGLTLLDPSHQRPLQATSTSPPWVIISPSGWKQCHCQARRLLGWLVCSTR